MSRRMVPRLSGLGLLLATARNNKNMTSRQVASALNITEQFWSGIERGRQPLPAKKIKPVTAVLGVDADVMISLMVQEYETKLRIKMENKLLTKQGNNDKSPLKGTDSNEH
jgi:transcriptional regulator with XRE-family HTH domain